MRERAYPDVSDETLRLLIAYKNSLMSDVEVRGAPYLLIEDIRTSEYDRVRLDREVSERDRERG